MESHLLQMRGLKLLELVDAKSAPLVASFTDAWIETHFFTSYLIDLKSRIFYRCVDWNTGPTLVRGMKPSEVASFTDAWIETPV